MGLEDLSKPVVDIRIRSIGSHRIAYLKGDLSMLTAPDIEQQLAPTFQVRGLSLVLDLGEVEFVDSSGFGALISWRHRVEHGGGSIQLMRVPKSLHTLLELSKMEGRFNILESEADLRAG